MFLEVLSIFIDVVTPVFTLVLVGYLVGPRLRLDARTLSRAGYFIFVPAFTFNIMNQANIGATLAAQMIGYISLVQLACAALGFIIAKLLGRPPEVVAAYSLIAVFSNVGNFGLSLIEFRLGSAALVPGTVYFLAVTVIAFVVGVAAASWVHSGGLGAVLAVFKTPALLALLPIVFLETTHSETPLFITRIMGLLGSAMIPVMLLTLGVQLAEAGKPQLNLDLMVASGVRLLGGPLVAMILVIPFGLTGLERSAGILQASMPPAVLASIIAMEYNIVPKFVTTIVLFSTLVSLITLTIVLSLV